MLIKNHKRSDSNRRKIQHKTKWKLIGHWTAFTIKITMIAIAQIAAVITYAGSSSIKSVCVFSQSGNFMATMSRKPYRPKRIPIQQEQYNGPGTTYYRYQSPRSSRASFSQSLGLFLRHIQHIANQYQSAQPLNRHLSVFRYHSIALLSHFLT